MSPSVTDISNCVCGCVAFKWRSPAYNGRFFFVLVYCSCSRSRSSKYHHGTITPLFAELFLLRSHVPKLSWIHGIPTPTTICNCIVSHFPPEHDAQPSREDAGQSRRRGRSAATRPRRAGQPCAESGVDVGRQEASVSIGQTIIGVRAPIQRPMINVIVRGGLSQHAATSHSPHRLGDLKNNAPNLKEIKPRVDTHWKRENPLVANKPLTRTDTIKLGGLAGRVPTAVVIGQPKLVRTRTLQTAKPEVAQRVMRVGPAADVAPPVRAAAAKVSTAAATAESHQARSVVQHVRRQESNLTRRSLTKLRAAMQKEKQQQIVNGGESTSVSSSLESLEDHLAPVSHSSISIADVSCTAN